MTELKDLAETTKKKLGLKYNAESVKYIEGFIDRTRESVDSEKSDGFVASLGAFIGQCIIENFGGKWNQDENGNICVEFDEQNRVYPFAKVKKQFDGGEGDRVYSFYSIIPKIFNKENPNKRKWWRK